MLLLRINTNWGCVFSGVSNALNILIEKFVLVDLQQPAISLEVRGKSQELNVSWSVQPPFSDSLQEYVVQHKPVGLPHSPCLNWVKVHKTQTFVKLTGRCEK